MPLAGFSGRGGKERGREGWDWQQPKLHAPSGGPQRQEPELQPNPKDFIVWRPQSIQSRGGLLCSSGLHTGPSCRRRGMLGGGPEPLALILARVGCPHVLPSLHLLQTVLVHFPLGEDEEEDTTGEADGPRGGEMCTGFGEGPCLSQRSWGKSHSNFIDLMNTAIPLVSVYSASALAAGGPHENQILLLPCLKLRDISPSLPNQVQTPRHGTKRPSTVGSLLISSIPSPVA